jgi:hypothetical protein
MADNITISAGSGTTVSTEEVTTLNGGAVSAQHVQRVAAAIRTADGTAVDLPGDSANGLDVDVTRASISGDVADDAADSGSPLKTGGKARTAERTAVAANDRVDAWYDTAGRQVTRPNSLLEDLVNGNASNTDGTSTQVIATSGAGVKTYITDVTISNTSSSNIYVELKDGTTVKWTFPVPANGGVTHHFASPIPGTANTAWNFDPSAATTTVYCSAAGFKSKI